MRPLSCKLVYKPIKYISPKLTNLCAWTSVWINLAFIGGLTFWYSRILLFYFWGCLVLLGHSLERPPAGLHLVGKDGQKTSPTLCSLERSQPSSTVLCCSFQHCRTSCASAWLSGNTGWRFSMPVYAGAWTKQIVDYQNISNVCLDQAITS